MTRGRSSTVALREARCALDDLERVPTWLERLADDPDAVADAMDAAEARRAEAARVALAAARASRRREAGAEAKRRRRARMRRAG